MTEPTYHSLTRSERDHLLATAHLHDDDVPNGQDIQRRVETLRGGDRPANNTTYPAMSRLQDCGYVEAETVDGHTRGYRLTVGGHQALEDAAELFRPDYTAED